MRVGAAGFLSRTVIGLASQVISSVTNLGLSVMVARSVTASEFGAWAIAYSAFVILLAVNRAVVSTPMMVLKGGNDTLDSLRVQDASASASVSLGIVAGAVMIALAALIGGPVSGPLAVLGVFVFGLLLHDNLRYVFMKREQPRGALALDLGLAIAQVVGFGILVALDSGSAQSFTAVWGGSALLAALGGLVYRRLVPAWRSAIWYLRRNRDAIGKLLVDSVLTSSAANLLPVIVGGVVGLSAAGHLRAGQTLMGLLGLVIMGLTPIMTIEVVKLLDSGVAPGKILWGWSLFTLVVGAVVGVALLNFPQWLGVGLLGDSWAGAQMVLVPLVVQGLIRGPFTGVPILLKASQDFSEMVRLRVRTSVVVLAVPFLGAFWFGLEGAAWGLVVAGLWSNMQSVASLRRSSRTTP